MEDRYKRLASHTVRNIAAYNDLPGIEERMPFVVLIIDELADLIMREGRKVEDPIVKIAQKARAVGIHLVLATQRPSVNVVTGLIKANVPSRIAFAMASNVDSRTVLDQPGAEDLIGRGDMLYQPVDLPRPVRLQGVFVSDKEVTAVTSHWRNQAEGPFYDESIFAFVDGEENGSGQFGWLAKMAEDDMVVRAAELVTTTGRASTSSLQTKLKVGFSRASAADGRARALRDHRPPGSAQSGCAADRLRPGQLADEPGRRGRPGRLTLTDRSESQDHRPAGRIDTTGYPVGPSRREPAPDAPAAGRSPAARRSSKPEQQVRNETTTAR